MINYSKQTIDSSDLRAVSKTLKSNYLTQGPKSEQFESKIRKYTGNYYKKINYKLLMIKMLKQMREKNI